MSTTKSKMTLAEKFNRWRYLRAVRRSCLHPSHRLSDPIFDERGNPLQWCYECNNQAVG